MPRFAGPFDESLDALAELEAEFLSPEGVSPVPAAPETAEAEYARLLANDAVAHLRQIGRRRGVRVAGTKKADIVAQLASALAEPASVDDALAALDQAGRRALVAAVLATVTHQAHADAITTVYRALGMEPGDPPLGDLFDLGLLARADPYSWIDPPYLVPSIVAAHLPPPADLVAAAPADALHDESAAEGARLGLLETIQIVAHELNSRPVALRPVASPAGSYYVPSMPGWRVDERESDQNADPLAPPTYRRAPDVRLIPEPPLLSKSDRQRLARLTAQPPAAVEFVVSLLMALGIASGRDPIRVDAERVARSLLLPASDWQAMLVDTWLDRGDRSELVGTFGRSARFELRARVGIGPMTMPLTVAPARLITANLIGLLAPGVWYDFAAFVARLRAVEPNLLGPVPAPKTTWWIVRRDRPGSVVHASTAADWSALCARVVAAICRGPLTWLGLVDTISVDSVPVAIRARPEAGVLVGRRPPPLPAPVTTLHVEPDLTVAVPTGADPALYGVLATIGEVVDATPAGLRFRLSASQTRAAFDAGLTDADLIASLARYTRTDVPSPARQALERWWTDYGAVRLYDELNLIELGDDYLLPELLATTPLRDALVHTFSPRLIAVEPARVDELIATLTRLGHTPRVVEPG